MNNSKFGFLPTLSVVIFLSMIGEVDGQAEPLAEVQAASITAPVIAQLEAYNNKDLEAFLIPYSDTVKVYNYPDKFQYQGKETMRENYSEWFETATDLHCKLVDRIVLKNKVIDHEEVTVKKGSPPFRAVAIYTVDNGYITRVEFLF